MEEEYVCGIACIECMYMECASASGTIRRSLTVIWTAVCVPWILCIHPLIQHDTRTYSIIRMCDQTFHGVVAE